MGASTSKTASKAASSAVRRTYPTRSSSAPEPTWSSKAPSNIGTSSHTAPGGSPTSESPQGNAIRAAASESFQNPTSQRGQSPTQQSSIDPQYNIPEDRPGPTVHSNAGPSETKNEAIDLDARDPVFASRLSQLGPVKSPYPQYSPSSTAGEHLRASGAVSSRDGAPAPTTSTGLYPDPSSNPAVAMLMARARIAEEAEQEKVDAGRKGFEGRVFMDVSLLKRVLVMRDEKGMGAEEIEKECGLRRGSVAALGRVGVVEVA